MEIPTDVKLIDFNTSTIWFDEDGIMFSSPKPGMASQEVNKEEILEQMKKLKEIIGYKKVCMVLETNNNSRPPEKENRDLIAEQLAEVTKAMAIISTSPLSRMIANLFFGLKPPPYPVKFVANQTEAKEWIKKHL
jgi:hypothetical protein